MSSWTRNRFAAMQLWPLFWQRAATPTLTAASRSADGSTTKGSLPPSSSTVFLTSSPATFATAAPALELPVRVTARMRLSRNSRSTTSEPINSVWKTPRGAPARSKTSSAYRAVWGTFDACFSRTTLPAMTPGAANRVTWNRGKFHGMTASTGPSGW